MRSHLSTTFYCVLLSLLTFQCNSLTQLSRDTSSRSGSTGTENTRTSQVRQNIVNYALQQQGARYKYAGVAPRTGFDCSGLTYYVFESANINLTHSSRVQENEGKVIKVEQAQAGDLIFFRKNRGGTVFHVALVVDNTREGIIVVHSTSSRGVIRENISNSSYWKGKVWSARDVISW